MGRDHILSSSGEPRPWPPAGIVLRSDRRREEAARDRPTRQLRPRAAAMCHDQEHQVFKPMSCCRLAVVHSCRSPWGAIVGLGGTGHGRTRPRPLRHKRGPSQPTGQRRSAPETRRPALAEQSERLPPQHSWHRRSLLTQSGRTPTAEATALAEPVVGLDGEDPWCMRPLHVGRALRYERRRLSNTHEPPGCRNRSNEGG